MVCKFHLCMSDTSAEYCVSSSMMICARIVSVRWLVVHFDVVYILPLFTWAMHFFLNM